MPEKRELRWAFPSTRQRRRDRWITAGVLVVWFCLFILGHPNPPVTAQTKPAGEMWWSLDVTLAPAWFDPGEVVGLITSFWVLYAMHDALVKPLPGNLMTPSLAESWTMSADQLVYEFKLREGLQFHNGDPFTAEDVKFSFLRCKGAKLLREKVCDIEIVDPHRVRLAANYAIDRVALSEAETLGASQPTGSIILRNFEFALPIAPYPYDPTKAKKLLAEAGYPHGFDAGELHQIPPYFSMGESIINYLGAVGIKPKLRPMERAAFFSAWQSKHLRGLCPDRRLSKRYI